MNILAAIVVIGLLAGAVWWVNRRRRRPGQRLLRDFKRVRDDILSGMGRELRPPAKALLADCESHLEALLAAKRQHRILGEMASTASELTGRSVTVGGPNAKERFNARLAEDLSNFFATLSRISTVVGLERDGTLDSLREFTEDLEAQRDALIAISRELAQPGMGVELPVTSKESELDVPTDHEEVSLHADTSKR